MSNRLYSNLVQSSGRRYYFALDSAPGIITPAPATLTLAGNAPNAVQPLTVFRTPAAAALTMVGISVSAPTTLFPAAGALSSVGQIPAGQRIRIITPALSPAVENAPPSFAPTLIPIWTTNPGVGNVMLSVLPLNLTQGGNIGFVSPGAGSITVGPLTQSLLLGGVPGVGVATIVGLAPDLQYENTVTPDVGLVTLVGGMAGVSYAFTWVDDDPAPSRTWITDAAA